MLLIVGAVSALFLQVVPAQAALPHGMRFNEALGVECAHCHDPANWSDAGKPAFQTAQKMSRMVEALNGEQLRGIGEIRCWTCHAGQLRPARQPRPAFEAELARWPPELKDVADSTRFAMAVYNVALGVRCDHCHVPGSWKAADKKPMTLVARMSAMFDEFPKYLPAKAQTQCYMCHKGSTKPKTAPDL